MEIKQVLNIKATYEANKDIAENNGISLTMFEYRMNNNYTLEEALTYPKGRHKNKRPPREYKTPEHETKQMIIQMLKAGVTVNKKYRDRFPELFEEAGR